MVNVPKREDGMLDKILEMQAAIKHARRLIDGFTITDSSLWPILSEIDMALSKASPRLDIRETLKAHG